MTDDLLTRMLVHQERLQLESYKTEPNKLTGVDRKLYVTASGFGLVTEIGEASAKIDWKPWASSMDATDRELYLVELIDALHFWFNLALVVRGPNQSIEEFASELFGIYLEKNQRNAKRQANGYDGRSTKCTSCGHALDDGAEYIESYVVIPDDSDHEETVYDYRCGSCGTVNTLEDEL